MKNYVSLHNHTEYSILDGLSKVKDLFEKANKYNMPAVSITDHGNLSGWFTLWETAKLYKHIKPIYGCEFYVWNNKFYTQWQNKEIKKVPRESERHYVLLSKNLKGYKNIIKLNWLSNQDETYYKHPRLLEKQILDNSEGVIYTSACMSGIFSQMIMNKQSNEIIDKEIQKYKEVFDDNFFLETMLHNTDAQREINERLIEFGKKNKVKTIVSSDSHYIDSEASMAQAILYFIKHISIKTIADPQKLKERHSHLDLSFHTYNELNNIRHKFNHTKYLSDKTFDELCENSLLVANMVERDDNYVNDGKLHFPIYKTTNKKTTDDKLYLVDVTMQSLKQKVSKKDLKKYLLRAKKELSLIIDNGYTNYFLILYDLLSWARNNGVSLGISRGSAGSSVVSWALNITGIDPIKHKLIFERFMGGGDKVRMPDIDIDISSKDKNLLENRLKEIYGKEKVCNVLTFNRYHLKGLLRDLTTALGRDISKTDKVTKEIKDTSISWDKFVQEYKNMPIVQQWLENNSDLGYYVKHIQGNIRHYGVHAGGVVVTPDDIYNFIPVNRLHGKIISGYPESNEYKHLQQVGVLKFDLLGISTVDLIQTTLDKINKTWDDLAKIDFDDKKIYDVLMNDTNHYGIFQMATPGMYRVAKKSDTRCFNDLVNTISLFRPGFLSSGMVKEYVARKRGESPVIYEHNLLKPILESTFGLLLYQEQIILIAHDIAGWSWANGDKLRKKLSLWNNLDDKEKKSLKNKLIKDIENHSNLNLHESRHIVKYLTQHIGYSFNRSHAVGYATLTIYTLYLKTYFFNEFILSLLTMTTHPNTTSQKRINEMFCFLQPYLLEKGYLFSTVDINISESYNWKLIEKTIGDKIKKIFLPPLISIKGFGKKTKKFDILMKSRPFTSVDDYIDRTIIDFGKSSSGLLAEAGAFSLITNEEEYNEQTLSSYFKSFNAKKYKQSKNNTQLSLFGDTNNIVKIKPQKLSMNNEIKLSLKCYSGILHSYSHIGQMYGLTFEEGMFFVYKKIMYSARRMVLKTYWLDNYNKQINISVFNKFKYDKVIENEINRLMIKSSVSQKNNRLYYRI